MSASIWLVVIDDGEGTRTWDFYKEHEAAARVAAELIHTGFRARVEPRYVPDVGEA